MAEILVNGSPMPCCAAPPIPDPKEPACRNAADNRWTIVDSFVNYAFCSQECFNRFRSHPDWMPAITAIITQKLTQRRI